MTTRNDFIFLPSSILPVANESVRMLVVMTSDTFSPKWRPQIASFLQLTVQNPKSLIIAVINGKEKQHIFTF